MKWEKGRVNDIIMMLHSSFGNTGESAKAGIR